MIESEYRRSGEVIQPAELIDKLEKEEAERAERILSLHKSRNGESGSESSRLGANLKNAGGSKRQVSFDELPIEEKEAIAARELQKVFGNQ